MSLIRKIKNLLLYAGATREEFMRVRNTIADANRKSLVLFSGVAFVTLLVLLFTKPYYDVLQCSDAVYIICMVVTLLFLALSYGPAKRSVVLNYLLIYAFMISVLVGAIMLGTVVEPRQASISYCLLMFAVPLMIVDSPVHINLMTIIGLVFYCIEAKSTQSPEMFAFNLSAILPYGIVGIIVTTFLMQLKIRSFVLQDRTEMMEKIQKLSGELEENQVQLEKLTSEQIAERSEQKRKQQRQLRIISSMAQVYYTSYYVDIEKNIVTELTSTDAIRNAVGETTDILGSVKILCEQLVQPEFKEDMEAFMDFSTLDERMKDTNYKSIKYKGVISGWSQAYLIEAKRNAEGRLAAVIFAARTIHNEKAKEEAQQKIIEDARKAAEAANAAKTSFLFNMSHDIRTPMNAIMGFTTLLRKHQDNPEKRADYLDKIESSSGVLLSIINNVLEMARIEKGNIELVEVPRIAEEINDSITSVFQESMKDKGINFTCTTTVNHHCVCIDPTKLREIIFNILSNAYKYTDEGGTVTMELKEVPSNREGYAMYQTTITDTGIGMSEDFLPHLFEEFSRENNSSANKIEGTGLGMPIVKRLVELMQGTIEVKSQKGKGTTFIITLPHKIVDNAESQDSGAAEFNPAIFEGKRILLAEDNDLNAEIATEILSEVGFIVARAADGTRCVEMMEQARAGSYDVILMDIQMPKMNGYEATKAIRQMEDPAKSNVPIIAMTANAFEEDSRRSIEAGMNGHLTKPINLPELFKTLAGQIV